MEEGRTIYRVEFDEMVENLEREYSEKIREAVSDLNDDDLMSLNREYCDANNYDDAVYSMDMLDELFDGLKPTEILEKLDGINTSDNFFKLDIYGAESSDYVSDLIDDIDDIADWAWDSQNSCYISSLQDVLDEYEAEMEKFDDYEIIED